MEETASAQSEVYAFLTPRDAKDFISGLSKEIEALQCQIQGKRAQLNAVRRSLSWMNSSSPLDRPTAVNVE